MIDNRIAKCLLLFSSLFAICCQTAIAEPSKAVVVVRPAAWQPATNHWIQYRQDYRIIEIDSVDNPYDLRQSILVAVRRSKLPVKAVLLCGDVAIADPAARENPGFRVLTPTFHVPTSVKLGAFTTPTLATDLYFGDVDDDEFPELAVGRLPAKNPTELERMLQRSIDYETSQSFGPWRDRIHATAGVGGFGIVADTAIETVTRRLLSEGIPDRFQLQMTYASLTSPYCPDPSKLTSSFINKINEGGLFWVYIGHGDIHRLDDFVVGETALPICDEMGASQFQVPDGAPIAVMLACFTGAFDAKIDCFAELLLARKDGPIAVIAGSRVTMPYGLSQFSTEMMDGCFRDRTETLGEIVLNAKRAIWNQTDVDLTRSAKTKDASGKPLLQKEDGRLREKQQVLIERLAAALSPPGHELSQERKEHVRLMNLLGDPLLQLRQPIEMEIACEAEPIAGTTLVVTGNSPLSGSLQVELVLSRDRLPDGLRPISNYDGSEEQRDRMQENYSRASNLVVTKTEHNIPSGDYRVELEVPPNLRGRCVLRAYVYGESNWASGSRRVKVTRSK